jgi:outer membrane protein OmpA-like peptidoglycan-associated protein
LTRWSILAFAALLTGCAQVKERVVLLPGPDGGTGALAATSEHGETLLATPYAAVEVKDGEMVRTTSNAEEVRSRYGALLAAQPPRPKSLVLYFEFDRIDLTAESVLELPRLQKELAAMPAAEIVIVGHTDTMGSESRNDRLALRRAEVVRATLIAVGIPASVISVAGRGEHDLAVQTADQVPEPRNRRAEIKIR